MKSVFVDAAVEGKNQIWRYMIAAVLVVVTYGAGIAALSMLGYAILLWTQSPTGSPTLSGRVAAVMSGWRWGTPFGLDDALVQVLLLVSSLFMATGAMLAVKLVHRRSATGLFLRHGAFRWGHFRRSLIAGLVVLGGFMALSFFLFNSAAEFNPQPAAAVAYLGIVVVLVPFQVFGEEVLFRGYLLQSAARFTRRWGWRLFWPAAVFFLAHLPGLDRMVGGGAIAAFAFSYLGISLYLTWLTLRTDGLEYALGLHIANNLIALPLVSSDLMPIQAPTFFYEHHPIAETAALTTVVMIALHYVIAVRRWFPGFWPD